jgi:CO/xanthine dehydrogenase Mo-binding subunit
VLFVIEEPAAVRSRRRLGSARQDRRYESAYQHQIFSMTPHGQLIGGSLMDYALPRADDLPSYDLGFNGTRCTTNPLGVKGCGEAGAVGAFPAVTNAVLDALAPLGVTDLVGPATPERIWRAIRAASLVLP